MYKMEKKISKSLILYYKIINLIYLLKYKNEGYIKFTININFFLLFKFFDIMKFN